MKLPREGQSGKNKEKRADQQVLCPCGGGGREGGGWWMADGGRVGA